MGPCKCVKGRCINRQGERVKERGKNIEGEGRREGDVREEREGGEKRN